MFQSPATRQRNNINIFPFFLALDLCGDQIFRLSPASLVAIHLTLRFTSTAEAKDQCQEGFADAEDQLRQVKGTQDVLRKNPGANMGWIQLENIPVFCLAS